MHEARIRRAPVRRAPVRRERFALAIAAALCLFSAPAFAGDRPWEQERWHTTYTELDANAEDHSLEQRWFESQLRTDDRNGSEYGRGLHLSLEENFLVSIQGPLAGEWAPCLAFELRF